MMKMWLKMVIYLILGLICAGCVNQNGQYTPLVADKFLAGETPVLLTDWLNKFSSRTIFFAVPFVREAEMEKAFKHPERKVGDKVMVDGVLFEPHPVIP